MAASSYHRLDSYPEIDSSDNHGGLYPRPEGAQLHQMPYSGYSPNSNYYDPPKPVNQRLKPSVHIPTAQSPGPLGVSDPSSRLRQRKFQKYKRILRICKFATKAISVIFSAIMFAFMMFMTLKYQTTENEFRNGRTAWPKHPKLWPTFMLLAGAGLTLLLSAVTLLSYCFCFDKARGSWKLTLVKYAIHILVWIIISTLYRYEKSLHGVNNDLWGWSCSQEAAVIQSEFNGVVDFQSLCGVQVTICLAILAVC
jgi:hypothetical protein